MRAALFAAVSLFEFSGRERFRYRFDILTVVGQARRLPSVECELETTRLGQAERPPYKNWNTQRADPTGIPCPNFVDALTGASA